MDNDPTDKILSYINELIERFRLPRMNLRLAGAMKIFIAGLVLVFIGYNLFFVYVRPDEYGISEDHRYQPAYRNAGH